MRFIVKNTFVCFFLFSSTLIFAQKELFDAVEKGNQDIVKSYIEAGVSPNTKDKKGYSLMLHAIIQNQKDITSYLLENGADVNMICEPCGQANYLITATIYEHFEIAYMLIDKGININTSTDDGMTPLHYAIMGNEFNLTKKLIHLGADLSVLSKKGNNLLYFCTNFQIFKFLLNQNLDINHINNKGRSVLWHFLYNEDHRFREALLYYGAEYQTKKHGPEDVFFDEKLKVSKGNDSLIITDFAKLPPIELYWKNETEIASAKLFSENEVTLEEEFAVSENIITFSYPEHNASKGKIRYNGYYNNNLPENSHAFYKYREITGEIDKYPWVVLNYKNNFYLSAAK